MCVLDLDLDLLRGLTRRDNDLGASKERMVGHREVVCEPSSSVVAGGALALLGHSLRKHWRIEHSAGCSSAYGCSGREIEVEVDVDRLEVLLVVLVLVLRREEEVPWELDE